MAYGTRIKPPKDKGGEAGKRLVYWMVTDLMKGIPETVEAFDDVGCLLTETAVRKWLERGRVPREKALDIMTIGVVRDIPELRHLDNVRRICGLCPHDMLKEMKARRSGSRINMTGDEITAEE